MKDATILKFMQLVTQILLRGKVGDTRNPDSIYEALEETVREAEEEINTPTKSRTRRKK